LDLKAHVSVVRPGAAIPATSRVPTGQAHGMK